MSGEIATPQPEVAWVIHTPLGFFRGYDLSVRSVVFTQDALFAQSWGRKDHAESYINSTLLVGIPTEVMPRVGAQAAQPMDAPAQIVRGAITSLNDRIGG